METLTNEGVMDEDWSIGTGTTNRDKDRKSSSHRNVNGPLVRLDLFQLAPPLPPDSGCGTLPWEKTFLPGMNDSASGGDRSTGKEKVVIDPVHVSWLSHARKFPASCYYNKGAGTINVSSSNNTVDSNATNPVSGYDRFNRKRRDATEEVENDRGCDVEEEGCSKKLRLSREQCALLEESFLKNTAPEHKQKRALALQLNLRPRQVEVWFQNRRARTKVKQTEVDCELLKRCNESLAEENRKLHKELEKLRAATLNMCPSCERVSAAENNPHFHLANAQSQGFCALNFRV